jgi:hypothetical protein
VRDGSLPNGVHPPVPSAAAVQTVDESAPPFCLGGYFFDYDYYTIREEVIPFLQQDAKAF